MELKKLQEIVEGLVIEISHQCAELTLAKLKTIIVNKKQGLNNNSCWTQLNIFSIVQALIKEGRVVGRVESGNGLESPRIFFNLDANHYKITQNIKRTVLELGTKFTRLQVAEITECCHVTDEALIIASILDMIARHQIDAQYFTSTKAVAFNQQANLQSRDTFIAELDAEFANWGMDSKK